MSLDLKPDFGDAKLNLGYVLKLLDEKDAAIEMLEAFRREQPHSNKVEAALKLVCELKGIPWEPRKPAKGVPPEILKPGTGRKKARLHREKLSVAPLVFLCIILILAVFAYMRQDVLSAAYERAGGIVGGFLSSEVNSDFIPEEESESDADKSEDADKPTGSDLLAGLFRQREAEDVLADDDWQEDPARGPVKPEPSGDEEKGTGEEENGDEKTPINIDPEIDSYWPLKVGNFWKYDGYELDRRAKLVEGSRKKDTIEVLRIARAGNTPVYEVRHLGNTSYFYENSEGIYKTNFPDRPFSTAIPNLVKPITIGEKWTDAGLGLGYEVMDEFDLEVPAGLFRVVQVKTWLTDFPEQITEVFFAKGIGPVKMVTGSVKRGFRIWEMTAYKVE
jgi:hypothetical protein